MHLVRLTQRVHTVCYQFHFQIHQWQTGLPHPLHLHAASAEMCLVLQIPCFAWKCAQTEWLAEWHATEQLFGVFSLTHTHTPGQNWRTSEWRPALLPSGHSYRVVTSSKNYALFYCFSLEELWDGFWVVGTSHVGLLPDVFWRWNKHLLRYRDLWVALKYSRFSDLGRLSFTFQIKIFIILLYCLWFVCWPSHRLHISHTQNNETNKTARSSGVSQSLCFNQSI